MRFNRIRFLSLMFIGLGLLFPRWLLGQLQDWRNAKNGNLIATGGYCDQPYVVVLKDGRWLAVYTTGASGEGSGGQHIVSCLSDDQGKNWTLPVQIEKPGKESASWAMPYLTDYGRVYVFYVYNGDKVHTLNGQENIREDMLGWYCYKYSDDEGKTWSQRYRLPVRKTKVDFNNDWKGRVQIFWGIGKPIDVADGMMFAFSKVGKYLIDHSEGWFFRCDNMNTERNPARLNWVLLPEGEEGLKNENMGPISEEQNIVQMNNGMLYCMQRTISGHPAESYSSDGGKTWTRPAAPKYFNGVEIKNPRACPRVWRCKNGKYLFWYHNNGGWDFNSRNPAWISGGIEKNGKIVWGQPEILLYEADSNIRMSYPDLIEQDGRYWITKTNKEEARTHEIPSEFLNILWGQGEINSPVATGLTGEWTAPELSDTPVLILPSEEYESGFTLDFKLSLGTLSSGQILLSSAYKNKTVVVETGEYGSVKIILKDGVHSYSWDSDPGLITPFAEHQVAVIVDHNAAIIQFIIDGTVCNGRSYRQFGWGWNTADMRDFVFPKIKIGALAKGQLRPYGKLTGLRIYNRPLMNSEIIGNHGSEIALKD